ncbi:hypothetical protein U9M48_009793 [Paspalum notatum var. saurae]|uniref:Disease resistance protein winged helix domain-containing protein n=1 Tax=Paspalum notatum var. saurae TaxID=547442 RepID=A0AAQ3WFS8_PASNO
MLPNNKASSSSSSTMDEAERKRIHAVLEKCYQDGDADISCMKMFLCALFLPDATTSTKLGNLEKKLQQGAEEPKEVVRIFCYSMLSTQQKSCLQYLTAFHDEESISRTSLVRRWVAEGIVGKEQDRTPEEVGERCFRELLFRGFVVEVGTSDGGTVRSCRIEDPIKEFIERIAKSENFVSELPSHLDRQLQIRKIVHKGRKHQEQELQDRWKRNVVGDLCCCGAPAGSDEEADSRAKPEHFKDPMDELVDFLKLLPHVYRLNVLDLGGCQGLKKRHLKSICKVVSLKYLSLRKTDVSRLMARHLQGLKNLETLDHMCHRAT